MIAREQLHGEQHQYHPKPEITFRNPNPGTTRNPKPETRKLNPEIKLLTSRCVLAETGRETIEKLVIEDGGWNPKPFTPTPSP
jgi:hypothetical protein